MNTLMWEHPLTGRHLRQLAESAGAASVPADLDLPELLAWMNAHCPTLRVVPPQSKRLACDDVGVGAMASLEELIAAVQALIQTTSTSAPPPKAPQASDALQA